ncbi:MAG: cytochrome c [Candidatus Rokubacteria bacterium]|nr:cytochrome c [Candidatus Rokubacteria bacterium]
MTVPVTVRVSVFALAVMGVYTWYANSIPQLESKPPEELSLEGGAVTPEQLVAAGEKIFGEKGQCVTCHGIGRAGRGPDLAGVGGRAGTRKPGMSAKAYLVESLLTPSAFVVQGFPDIMPRIDRPPIGLNRSELWATVAYLENLGGSVDVKLEDIPATAGAQAGGPAAALQLPGDPKAGQAVFTGKGGCFACHKAGAIAGTPLGPDLSNLAGSQTTEYIMGKILNPASKGVVSGYPPGVMPPTFGKALTAQEYMDLLAFLMTLKGGAAAPPAAPPK